MHVENLDVHVQNHVQILDSLRTYFHKYRGFNTLSGIQHSSMSSRKQGTWIFGGKSWLLTLFVISLSILMLIFQSQKRRFLQTAYNGQWIWILWWKCRPRNYLFTRLFKRAQFWNETYKSVWSTPVCTNASYMRFSWVLNFVSALFWYS